MSFIIYRGTKSKAYLVGTWNGIYSMNEKKMDLKIVFGPDNSIEMYNSDMNMASKAIGFYTISNNNKIAITGRWPGKDRIAFSMNGRLSPKKDFVNGGWSSGDYLHGGFFLANAVLK